MKVDFPDSPVPKKLSVTWNSFGFVIHLDISGVNHVMSPCPKYVWMGQTGPGRHPMNIVNNVYCGGQSVRMQSNAMNVGEQVIIDQSCSVCM